MILLYSTSSDTYDKTFIRTTKFRQLWKFWNFRYSLILAWDMERLYANYTIKSICHIYYAIDDVTAWRKIQSSIFPCKYIQCIFHHDFITNKLIISWKKTPQNTGLFCACCLRSRGQMSTQLMFDLASINWTKSGLCKCWQLRREMHNASH